MVARESVNPRCTLATKPASQYPKVGQSMSSFDNVKDIRAGAHSDYGIWHPRFFSDLVPPIPQTPKPLPNLTKIPNPLGKIPTGSLTLLFQRSTQSGLEILTPQSTWSPVPVSPPETENDAFPPILVNIGDLMQFWTNGLLKSTVHRVVFPGEATSDRYSIAYFCHPLDHVHIEAVPSEIVKERGNKTQQQQGSPEEPITAAGYLKKRLAETYMWGKEQKEEPSPARD